MEIRKREESREQCTEAGWYAYDYLLAQPMQREQIEALAAFGGSLLYLSSLAQPFYKLESRHYMIKGLQDSHTLRLAVYKEEEQEVLSRFEAFLKENVRTGRKC